MLSSYFNRFSSFTYLNVTQFLGALNVNIYKLLIIFFFIQAEGIGHSHEILATTGATFVIPFLLFSALSGTLADRFSKRDIIVTTKILELVVMGLGLLALAFQSKWGAYSVLFCLATQCALFGPSKYGIVPELVSTDRISRANGLMTSLTFFAIILGTFCASFLLQVSNRNYLLSSVFCTFIALAGLLTSFCIEHTPPSGSSKKIQIFFLRQIYQTLRRAMQEVSLFPAILGSAFFMFIGSFTQQNMIPFAVKSLKLSDLQGGYLFFLTAIGIGVGALVAGKLSGKIVELGLVPFGALGITITSLFLDVFSGNLYPIIGLVFALGLFGGIFQIPLDSYIQVASPKEVRGQMVGTSNFMGFFGVLLASALVYINSELFGLEADKGFLMISGLTGIILIIYTFQFFDYLTRFIGSILSKVHFKTTLKGADNIPECPAIYVCCHRDWNDTLLLLGSQRRRMRFFIEQEQNHHPWIRHLYHLLRVIFIPQVENLEDNENFIFDIQKMLKKGFSVCIFIKSWDIYSEVDRLHHSAPFNQIIKLAEYPIVPVEIVKADRAEKSPFFERWIQKIRVPASIVFSKMIYRGNESLLPIHHEHIFCLED